MRNKQTAALGQAYVFLAQGDIIRGDDEVLGDDFTAWVLVHRAAATFIGSPYAAIMKPVRRPVAPTAAAQPDKRAVSRDELEQIARRAVQFYAESPPRPSQVTMTDATVAKKSKNTNQCNSRPPNF